MTESKAIFDSVLFCLKIIIICCEAVKLYKKVLAITNNPLVFEAYKDKLDVTFIVGQYLDVLKLVRNKIHEGCRIITHPLMGSIKPNETPYRSLIIEYGTGLDMQSLSIIESSIATCEKFLKDRPTPPWGQKILEDFQFVDKRLFDSAYESLTQ